MARIAIMLMLLVSSSQLFAIQPRYNYSDKSVSELLGLLENNDATIRACAAIFLGDRFRDPKEILVNGPIHKTNNPPPELPVPNNVILKLSAHLKSDQDFGVRLCAVAALKDLKFHTNTTPFLVSALTNQYSLVRIRASSALIEISHKYSEKLPAPVIPTLKQCLLDSKEDVEIIWQAAYATEQLGKDGQSLIPALQQLKQHQSRKVRDYANRALAKIDSPK
jgi:hypothetical protein